MFLLTTLVTSPALALDIDTFEASPTAADQGTGLQVLDPHLGWKGSAYAGALFSYANDPMVAAKGTEDETAIVSGISGLTLMGGYGLGAARLEAALPFYPSVAMPEGGGAALGDLRLSSTVPIVTKENGLAIALAPSLALPTGSTSRYVGAGAVSAGLTAALGVRPSEKVAFNTNLGLLARPGLKVGDTQIGSALTAGAGLSYAATKTLRVGAELDGLVDFVGDWHANPWELHAYGRYGKDEGVSVIGGLGTGLVAGIGSPDVRVFAGVGWRRPGEPPIKDSDGDGAMDPVDSCPAEPEDKDGFNDGDGCPEADNDEDGLADGDDKCPNTPEDKDKYQDEDGCPEYDNDGDEVPDKDDLCPLVPGNVEAKGCPDADGDGLLDNQDECPDQKGKKESRGCPDQDADLVPDAIDACPTEPRDPREDPSRSDGCPKRVIVTLEKIEIKEMIYFDTNKTTIKKESFGLLEEIAKVIRENPDLAKIEIGGHTDNVGKDDKNLKLSQGRAQAVLDWLVKTGKVDAGRLVAVGYGETKPIETNETDAGRGANRRVEFVIKSVDASKNQAPPKP